MKNKKVIEWIKLGQFGGYFMFSCGYDYNEIIARLCRNDLDKKEAAKWKAGIIGDMDLINNKSSWGTALKRVIENKKTSDSVTLFYIIIKGFDGSSEAFIKLAHECVHICQFFLPDVLDRNKEIEAEAYFHTYIMQECIKVMEG